jgi:hypothetical protein
MLLVPALVLFRASMLLPQAVGSDCWLALVAGREIVHQGLPAHDSLTVWAHGRPWIDQQWLSQLGFYGLYAVGGLKSVALAHLAFLAAAVVLSLAAARHSGASSRAITWLSAGALPLILIAAVRPQSFVYVLFVGLLWLLVTEARRRSWRIWLTLPTLLLWANLHGSAVIGALLVALYGATYLFGHRQEREFLTSALRAAGLLFFPWLCLLASPYGLSLVDYYRGTLMNPAFSQLVTEWNPITLTLATAEIFGVLLVGIWLIGRHGRCLTLFEKFAFIVVGLLALMALRNIIWFGLAAVVLMPRAVDAALPPRRITSAVRRANLLLGASLALALVVCAAVLATRGQSWYSADYPSATADVVARAAQHSRAPVYANERYADWLLFYEPSLRGRVAYDARLELLTPSQLARVATLRSLPTEWRHAAAGYEVFALDLTEQAAKRELLKKRQGCLVPASEMLVIARGSAKVACGTSQEPRSVAGSNQAQVAGRHAHAMREPAS